MKTDGFRSAGGFERCSEATLLMKASGGILLSKR